MLFLSMQNVKQQWQFLSYLQHEKKVKKNYYDDSSTNEYERQRKTLNYR